MRSRSQPREGLPMLAGAFPLLGHVPRAYRGLPGLLRRGRAQVGPVYWLSLGFGQRCLVCMGPEAIEILRSPSFSSGHLKAMSPLVAGESLLGHDGAMHRRMRSAMNGPLSPRGLAVSTVGATMARELTGLAARWAERSKVRVVPEIHEVALAIIFRTLGVEPDQLPEWRARYRILLLANLGARPSFPGSPAWRAARAKRWIDARLREMIARARAEPTGGSLIGALVHSQDEEGRPLSEEELVDNVRLLVLGGHETIASTMAWLVITLGCRPDLWSALVDEAAGAPEVPTTPAAARAFPFAEALFRETVRMHPPFSLITRRCEEAFSLHGKTIPKGAMVGVDLWGAAHDAALFVDPDEFKPERWLGRSAHPSLEEIAQFGAGPHFCLGYPMAWLEAVQLAVALARELGKSGKRPQVRGARIPAPIFLPTEHPPRGTVVEMVRQSGAVS